MILHRVHGPVYLHTDAEECLGSIINSLRQSSLNVPAETDSAPGGLVEKYLMGEMTTECVCLFHACPPLTSHRLKCDEAPDEEVTSSISTFSKVECNISITTNYMHTGIKDVSTIF